MMIKHTDTGWEITLKRHCYVKINVKLCCAIEKLNFLMHTLKSIVPSNGVIMAVRILAVSAACISLTQRVFSFIIHLSFHWQRRDFQYLWNKHYYKMKQFKPHARYPRDEQFQHGTSMPHHGASVECIPSPEKPIHSSLLQNRKLQNRNTASILTSCSQNHLCRLWSVLQPPTAWAPTSQLPDALDISVVTMTQIYLFHL